MALGLGSGLLCAAWLSVASSPAWRRLRVCYQQADPNPELFSASADRCVKVWNFQRRATQIETLFGHQEGITALDAVQSDVVLSAAADRAAASLTSQTGRSLLKPRAVVLAAEGAALPYAP